MLVLGSATCVTGFISFFFLIDNPKSPAFNLNAEQEILVEERIRDNAVVRTSTIKKEQIYEALKEVRFWCFGVSCFLLNLQNGAMSAYIAQIAIGFGFTVKTNFSFRRLLFVLLIRYHRVVNQTLSHYVVV